MNPRECVLYSDGLRGAEAAFGEAAERHGVEEVNLTFEGHRIERSRGVRTLTAAELQHGDVSFAYVSKLMNRHYPETDVFKRVLQTIWHQVNNAQEVYVVGKILPDDTVMGGTGWGAEFAKLCNKPLLRRWAICGRGSRPRSAIWRASRLPTSPAPRSAPSRRRGWRATPCAATAT